MTDSGFAVRTAEQLSAALAGRYVVEREIGAGGMATVYLARDVRHNRQVALKVLKPDLGAALGPERFLTEIQVTANLQHPNLLPLFDSGEAKGEGGSLLFYVMPYVEGQTLRDRLRREGQLPVEEALHIAVGIAGALDYAHRRGVVHRDLKPENILLHEGQPVVMDFGIALAVSNAGGERLTQMGLSLGTPQYMSPEQATGDRDLDARSDIYSLGAVLYEMLAGVTPHSGNSIQAVIAKVIMDKPSAVRVLRETVPAHVDAAIARALSKLPADRFASAADFAKALGGDLATSARTSQSAPHALILSPAMPSTALGRVMAQPVARVAVVGASWLALLGGAAAVGATMMLALMRTPAPPLVRIPLTIPDSVSMSGVGRAIAVSPDGSRLAIAAAGNGGASRLFGRPMGGTTFSALHGTDSASAPSYSPKGDWLLFAAGRRLMKVPADGGVALKLADSTDGRQSWGDGDHVVFTRRGAVWVVPSGGGAARLVANPDSANGQRAFSWPDVLPGGKDALITIVRDGPVPDSSHIAVISLEDGEVTDLGIPGTGARYAEPGQVVYATAGGSLWSVPFNLRKRAVAGDKKIIAEGVHVDSTGAVDVAVAGNGTLVYGERSGGSPSGNRRVALGVVDHTGTLKQTSVPRGNFFSPRVSPDGSRIALTIGEASSRTDVWIFELATGGLSPMTRDKLSQYPEWLDAKRIVFRENSTEPGRFMMQPYDHSADPQVFFAPAGIRGAGFAYSLSLGPSRGYMAFVRNRARGAGNLRQDIGLAPMLRTDSQSVTVSSNARELTPRISPNGKWLAYTSDKSGVFQLYVEPVPGPGPVVPVSVEHGIEPVWSRDGKVLYYVSRNYLLAAHVDERSGFQATKQDTLFSFAEKNFAVRVPGRGASLGFYDVFQNGDFAVLVSGNEVDASRTGIVTILNWQQLLSPPSTGTPK